MLFKRNKKATKFRHLGNVLKIKDTFGYWLDVRDKLSDYLIKFKPTHNLGARELIHEGKCRQFEPNGAFIENDIIFDFGHDENGEDLVFRIYLLSENDKLFKVFEYTTKYWGKHISYRDGEWWERIKNTMLDIQNKLEIKFMSEKDKENKDIQKAIDYCTKKYRD